MKRSSAIVMVIPVSTPRLQLADVLAPQVRLAPDEVAHHLSFDGQRGASRS
jgi:hypothetical protein